MVTLKNFLKKYSSLFFLFLLFACASGNRKERGELQALYVSGDYDKAIELLEKGKIKKDNDSKLLYLWEMGKLHHSKGNWEISSFYFSQAHDLSQKYYTKSLSKSAKSLVSNDNYKIYDGELFERSLSYFYQSLNFLMMYQTGQGSRIEEGPKEKKVINYELEKTKRRQALLQARAQVLAWDSFFQDIQRSTRYDTIYKNDLIVKVYGGLIHEATGKRSDEQIALQLYKDANTLLEYLGSTYVSYNSKSKDFTEQFLEEKNKFNWKIKDSLLVLTSQSQNLKDFLHYKILSLTKKVRASDLKNQIKLLSPSQSIITKAKKTPYPNTSIIIQDGVIAGKSAKEINFGLHGALEGIKDPSTRVAVHRIGSDVLTIFMIQVLGLTPKNAYAHPGEFAFGHAMGRVGAEFASIDFEIPVVKNIPVTQDIIVSFYQGTSKVKEEIVPLIAPLDDMAAQAVEERVFSTYTKTGIRIGLKHIAAIVAAYAIYKKMDKSFAGKLAAMGSYLAAQRAIAATEKADVRFWSTLPKSIRLLDTYLKDGVYVVKVRQGNSEERTLGNLTVDANQKNIFTYQLTK